MKACRSILITFMYFIFGLGAVILNFIVFPLLKKIYKDKQYRYLCSDIIRVVWKIFIQMFVLLGLIKIDIKNIAKIENKIIVATHPSFIDVLILISLFPRTTCFVKKELQENPILKNIIDSIFMTNDMELEDLKQKTKEMLDMGFNIVVFPTGRRHRKNEHLKIRKGASLIALNSDKNIVPIRIWTDDDFLFINQPFYSVGAKTVTFTIEQKDEINIPDYKNDSEIITKREITKTIESKLYENSD